MDLSGWLVTALGVVLVALVMTDVLLTVLHVDMDGLALRIARMVVWPVARLLGRTERQHGRVAFSLAGPLILSGGFLLWLSMFVFGFALIYWPHLANGFRSAEGVANLGFMEAVYYSLVTGTVLGYGDISPLIAPLQLLSGVQSALGFALFTGVVTYLLSVTGGITERSSVSHRLYAETGFSGDGARAVTRFLPHENPEQIAARFRSLTGGLLAWRERLHQLPLLGFYYRSLDPHLAPESLVQMSVTAAIAGLIAADEVQSSALRFASDDMASAAEDVMKLIASGSLDAEAMARIENPQPGEADRGLVTRVRAEVRDRLGQPHTSHSTRSEERAIVLAGQLRHFMSGAERATGATS